MSSLRIEPFIVDIRKISKSIQGFLQANILIINIPSKNIDSFRNLLEEIEVSDIEKVLFVSSTSVYEKLNVYLIRDGRWGLLKTQNLIRPCILIILCNDTF